MKVFFDILFSFYMGGLGLLMIICILLGQREGT